MREWGEIDSEEDQRRANLWQGAVKSAIRSKRGQTALREIHDILHCMFAVGNDRLIAGRLCDGEGQVCTLGALALHRMTPDDLEKSRKFWSEMSDEDAACHSYVMTETIEEGLRMGLSSALASTIAERNDWYGPGEVSTARFHRMLAWVESQIIEWKGETV
jgi:hypothetical protein